MTSGLPNLSPGEGNKEEEKPKSAFGDYQFDRKEPDCLSPVKTPVISPLRSVLKPNIGTLTRFKSSNGPPTEMNDGVSAPMRVKDSSGSGASGASGGTDSFFGIKKTNSVRDTEIDNS